MTLTFGPRARALLIVGVLALAAVGAGLMVLGRTQNSPDASTGHASTPPTSTPATSTPATSTAAPSAGAPATPSAGPRQTTVAPAGAQLPAAIRQALAANRVVVVALYDPGAKIDDTALHEAQAGAQLAGVSFVQVDVTTDQVDALNARYGAIQDPAVLVLRPPGDLVVRIDGFADRDTVAQAAANAVSS